MGGKIEVRKGQALRESRKEANSKEIRTKRLIENIKKKAIPRREYSGAESSKKNQARKMLKRVRGRRASNEEDKRKGEKRGSKIIVWKEVFRS